MSRRSGVGHIMAGFLLMSVLLALTISEGINVWSEWSNQAKCIRSCSKPSGTAIYRRKCVKCDGENCKPSDILCCDGRNVKVSYK